jgi:hypothetical protein
VTGSISVCSRCGTQLNFPGQVFCAHCGQAVGVPTSAPAQPAAAQPATPHPLQTTPWPTSTPAGPSAGMPLLELGLGLVGLAALVLPLITYEVSSSYFGSASGSVSVLDYIQRTNWTGYGELDLVVIGAIAATGLALLRLLNPAGIKAPAIALGFVALAGGMLWMLSEFNSASSFLNTYGSSVYSAGLSQGIGLWLGLTAGAIGTVVCLMDHKD